MPASYYAASTAVYMPDESGGLWLLGERKNEPWKQRWSLPGGRIENNETAKQAAARELAEETGLHIELDAFHQFTQLTLNEGFLLAVHIIFLTEEPKTLEARDDCAALKWHTLDEILALRNQLKTPQLDDVMLKAQAFAQAQLAR